MFHRRMWYAFSFLRNVLVERMGDRINPAYEPVNGHTITHTHPVPFEPLQPVKPPVQFPYGTEIGPPAEQLGNIAPLISIVEDASSLRQIPTLGQKNLPLRESRDLDFSATRR